MIINLNNIEEIIFKNAELKLLLPDLRHIFDQWYLSYRSAALSNMRKMSLIELLNSLDNEKIKLLSNFFKESVVVEKLDTHTVKNIKIPIDSIKEGLTNYQDYNIVLSRNAIHAYICLWR